MLFRSNTVWFKFGIFLGKIAEVSGPFLTRTGVADVAMVGSLLLVSRRWYGARV